MRFEVHNTVRRWGARHSYVVLAFILIIIVLILAGCASFNRVHEDNGTLTAGSVEDVTGGIVGADSSLDHRPRRSSAARSTSKRRRSSSESLARPSSASGDGSR